MSKLRYLTSGESHGPALTVILEGMPSGVPVFSQEINRQLFRRQQGYGRGGRMTIEKDQVQILSGIRFGKTLGSPITLQIHNKDWKTWSEDMAIEGPGTKGKREVVRPRPGHADLPGGLKYDHRDLRNVLERASARETTARVACGALARQLLSPFEIKLIGYIVSIGDVAVGETRPPFEKLVSLTEASPVRTFDPKVAKKMIALIDVAKKKGDSLGGIFEVVARGLPVGIGSYVQWDRKLDGQIAQAVMSIQAIKGVEIGLGFGAAAIPGSRVHDPIAWDASASTFTRPSNGAGGLEGGITNGNPVVARAAMKPIATLRKPLPSVHVDTKVAADATFERSDICAVAAASVVGEAMMAICLADALLEKFGGDSLKELLRNLEGYRAQLRSY